MEITLKKAHKIVTELQNKMAKSLEAKNVHRLSLTTFNEVQAEVVEHLEKNEEILERLLKLSELAAYLRKSIKKENLREVGSNEESVESIMHRKATAENVIRILRNYTTRLDTTQADVVSAKWKEAQEASGDKGSLYSQAQQYVTLQAIVSPEVHNEMLEKVKKAKEEQEYCVDRLGVLNNTLTVVLSEEDVALLKEVDIL